jgi:hypothetical protein
MIWSTFPTQDATIYEKTPDRNTGLDPILELGKTSVTTSSIYETRFLIKFDTTKVQEMLTNEGLSVGGNYTASLSFTTADISDSPFSYTIEAVAVTGSWLNGSGVKDFSKVNDGVTWYSPNGGAITDRWNLTGSGTQKVFNSVSGGGNWNSGASYYSSQSFNLNSTNELNLNVTNIVNQWLGGVSNEGFLVKLKNSELVQSTYPDVLLQFYGANTQTVYQPVLTISWPGTQVYDTGSMTVISKSNNPIIYTKYLNGQFIKDTKARIYLGARPMFPRPSFQQNSVFSTEFALPSGSYYQIKDAHNDSIIIPYSNNTKLNIDASGSYFDFYTTMMYPERYYKFEIKSNMNGFVEYFTSNEFIFKITR